MKLKYRDKKCSLCGEHLNSPLDLVLYNIEDNEVCEMEFRHQKCDERRFVFSRHVKEGFADIVLRFKKYTDRNAKDVDNE